MPTLNVSLLEFFEFIDEAVIVLDPEGKIVYVNKAYTDILGVSVKKVLNRNVVEVEPTTNALKVYKSNAPIYNQVEIIKSLGMPVHFHAIPVFERECLIAVVCIFREAPFPEILKKEDDGGPGSHSLNAGHTPLPEILLSLGGKNKAFMEALRLTARVAPTDSTILIEGESGTGKDLLAQVIHRLSPRKDKPFVAINCPAIPEGLSLQRNVFHYPHLGQFSFAVGAIGPIIF